MDSHVLTFAEEKGKSRNKSQLSYVDCCMRLCDDGCRWSFEDMSDDDLDSIYFVAFQRWAYHLTRQAYIDALNTERKKRND